jgi:SAM-dependent methyltransferase
LVGTPALPGKPPQGSLRRSIELYRAFRAEQSDPDRFYGLLATDSATQVAGYVDLHGRTVLDVGGGPGYFADAFRARGARYVAVDPDLRELSARADPGPGTVLGTGIALPVRTGAVDVCYSSNVLEHVPEPERMADEMVRVTRPGGIVVLAYTLWYGPHGGHEMSPWHLAGGRYATRRYVRRYGAAPKHVYGESLFPITIRRMLHWQEARERSGRIAFVDLRPRYHPAGLRWLVKVPGLREVLTWNVVLVLRVR